MSYITLYIYVLHNQIWTLCDRYQTHAISIDPTICQATKLFAVVKIINFNITRSEVVGSCQQLFGLICGILIIEGWFVGVTKVGVGRCSTISVVSNVNIMTTSKCRTITVIGIYCIRVVLVDWRFKRC